MNYFSHTVAQIYTHVRAKKRGKNKNKTLSNSKAGKAILRTSCQHKYMFYVLIRKCEKKKLGKTLKISAHIGEAQRFKKRNH